MVDGIKKDCQVLKPLEDLDTLKPVPYESVEKLDVCEKEGYPSINDEYLLGGRRLLLVPEERKKEAIDEIFEEKIRALNRRIKAAEEKIENTLEWDKEGKAKATAEKENAKKALERVQQEAKKTKTNWEEHDVICFNRPEDYVLADTTDPATITDDKRRESIEWLRDLRSLDSETFERLQRSGLLHYNKGEKIEIRIEKKEVLFELPSEGNYELCSSEKKDLWGETPIYRYFDNTWLSNSNAGKPYLKALDLRTPLTNDEKMQLIKKLKYDRERYGISQDQAKLFYINSTDVKGAEELQKDMASSSDFSPERAVEINAAITEVIKPLKEEFWERFLDRLLQRIATPFNMVLMLLFLLATRATVQLSRRMAAIQEKLSGKKDPILPTLEDLNAKAKAGELEPIPQRLAPEQKDIAATLAPGKQAKPIIVGENGTNKTTAAKSIAQAAVDGKFVDGTPIPDYLKGKEFVYVSGAKEFAAPEGGQYVTVVEQKFRQFIEECKKAGKIPIIDEIHALIRAGRTSQEVVGPLGDILKAEPDFPYIGMTTPEEYRMIERDKALPSRMVRINHGTPTFEQARSDFIETRWFLEKSSGKSFPDVTLDAALSYLDQDTSTNFPRKLFEFFKNLKDRLGVQGIETGVVQPEHAREYIAYKTEAALVAAMEQAAKELQEAQRPAPEVIEKIESKSVRSFLESDVWGLDKLDKGRADYVVELIRRSWSRLSELDKSAYIDSSEEKYAVPRRFMQRQLKNDGPGSIAAQYGLKLKAPVAAAPGNTNGPKGPEGPKDGPPSAGAVGGTGEAAPPKEAEGAKASEEAKAERTMLAKERGLAERLGGMPSLAAILIGIETLQHYGAITEEERTLIDQEILGTGFLASGPFFAAELGAGAPGAFLGHAVTAKVANATGIEGFQEGELGNKLTGILGGLAGFFGSIKLFERTEFWQNAKLITTEATTALKTDVVSKVGSVGMEIEQGIMASVREMAMGIRMYGAQAVNMGRTVLVSGLGALESAAGTMSTFLRNPTTQTGLLTIPAGAVAAAGVKAALTAKIAAGAAATGAAFTAAAGAGVLLGYGVYKSGATEAVGIDGSSGSWVGSTWVGDLWYNIGGTNLFD